MVVVGLMIIMVLGLFTGITDAVSLKVFAYRLTEKIEISVISAFSEVDLEVFSERANISNEQNRDIYLDKDKAKETIKEFLKKNLELDESFRAKKESIIKQNKAVIIDDIRVYNPNELPTVAPNNQKVERTSIYIHLRVPINFKYSEKEYQDIKRLVDLDSFLTSYQ